jgi:uncharacterized membrane protein YfcA
VTPQAVALAILVVLLLATRPLEERWWRAGRISSRTAAILIVARLPVLAIGTSVASGRDAPMTALFGAGAAVLAAALYPVAVRRLRRLANRPGSTVKARGPGQPRSR